MKTLQQIVREFEDRRERLGDASEAVRRRGGTVPVRREELATFAELCSQPIVSRAAAPRPSSATSDVPEYAWIRC